MNCVNMNLDPIPIKSRNVFLVPCRPVSALVDDWNIIYA